MITFDFNLRCNIWIKNLSHKFCSNNNNKKFIKKIFIMNI